MTQNNNLTELRTWILEKITTRTMLRNTAIIERDRDSEYLYEGELAAYYAFKVKVDDIVTKE
jgi:hypothetical protein